MMKKSKLKIILFANTDWYLYNFRRSLANALCDAGHDVLLISPLGIYGEKLRNLGFRWTPIPMNRRSLNPFREFTLLLWLRKLIRQEQVDLVHGFTIKCAVYGSLAAKLAGVSASVSAVAGMGYVFTSNDLRARLLRPIVRSLMRLALNGQRSRLILQNRDDVELFRATGCVDQSRIQLIPGSGVDCSRFTARTSSLENKPFRVLLASRLLWDKGIAEYIDAARALKAEKRTISFLLAGNPDPGNPASVPESVVKEWENEGLIEWLGHIDDMPSLFSTVDLVVLPSYREGLPKTLIEAAACGLPIITTDVPGCREVVINEVDGLLVPAQNATALKHAIARLQDNPEFSAKLGATAREKALAQFDERIVIEQTLAVYEELFTART
jgi:glycosyltransferase involved in cell wall biosynthesis